MRRGRHRLRVIGLALGIFVYGVALRSNAAEKSQARLVYVLGAGVRDCPAPMQLRIAVTARLGYDPFSATAPRTVIAQIEEKSSELLGHVELVSDENVSQGARELTAPGDRCSELVRAMALSISIAIDPESALHVRNESPLDANVPPGPTQSARAAVAQKTRDRGDPRFEKCRACRSQFAFSRVRDCI